MHAAAIFQFELCFRAKTIATSFTAPTQQWLLRQSQRQDQMAPTPSREAGQLQVRVLALRATFLPSCAPAARQQQHDLYHSLQCGLFTNSSTSASG
jgi:hypothetical protein